MGGWVGGFYLGHAGLEGFSHPVAGGIGGVDFVNDNHLPVFCLLFWGRWVGWVEEEEKI